MHIDALFASAACTAGGTIPYMNQEPYQMSEPAADFNQEDGNRVYKLILGGLLTFVLLALLGGLYFYKDSIADYLRSFGANPTGEIHLSLIPNDRSALEDFYRYSISSGQLIVDESLTRAHRFNRKTSPDQSEVAYVKEVEDGSYQLFVASLSTAGEIGEEKQVTTSGGDKKSVSWSADGSKLLFSSAPSEEYTFVDPYDPGEWDFGVIDLATQEETRLGKGLYPQWGDNDRIAVLQRDGLHVFELGTGYDWIVWTTTGGPARTNMHMDLSDDASKVAITDVNNGEIVVLDISFEDYPFASFNRTYEATGFWPVFSPDGAFIAFEEVEMDGDVAINQRLSVLKLRNGNIRELQDLTSYDQTGLWIDEWTPEFRRPVSFQDIFIKVAHAIDQPGEGGGRGPDCSNGGGGGGGGSVGGGGGGGGNGGGGNNGGCECGTFGRADQCKACPPPSPPPPPYVFTIELFVDNEETSEGDPYEATEPADYRVHWLSNDTSTLDDQRPQCGRSGDWNAGNTRVNKSGGEDFTDMEEGEYEYHMSCTFQGQQASDTAYVTVTPPVPTVDLDIRAIGDETWADEVAIDLGENVELTWSSTNATRCVGDTHFSTGSAPNDEGTQQTVAEPASGERTYAVRCYNGPSDSDPNSTDSVTVNVLASAPEIAATPALVNSGETSTIEWELNGHTQCAIDASNGDVIGTDPLTTDGSGGTSAMYGEVTYTITCDDTGATDTAKVRIRPDFDEL